MEKIKIDLVIERGENTLSGRVNYNDNLIVDFASNVLELENQIKALLHDFEDVNPEQVEFIHYYDVYALFEEFDFINISKFAKYAGINPGLMRQYASGVKNPALAQARKIEEAIRKFTHKIERVSIYAH
jgi:hypothetical protein